MSSRSKKRFYKERPLRPPVPHTLPGIEPRDIKVVLRSSACVLGRWRRTEKRKHPPGEISPVSNSYTHRYVCMPLVLTVWYSSTVHPKIFVIKISPPVPSAHAKRRQF